MTAQETTTEQESREIGMFGVTSKTIEDCVTLYTKDGVYTPKSMVMSMLSDVQELMGMGLTEKARQKINVAKYILSYHVKAVEKV
jgi:Mor family transcriptional regulator